MIRSLIIVFALAVSLSATIINVPADQANIQTGINIAVDGDTVLVHPGTYVENVNFSGKNVIVGSLFLTSGDTSYISQTIIDGNGSQGNGSVVSFESGEDSTALFSGFTITNGWDQTHGGGILCADSSPCLEYLIVRGNGTDQQGGGIDCRSNSNPVIRSVKISGNTAEDGGGIHFLESSPTLIEVTIVENTGVNGGGASAWWGGEPIFINVTIAANIGSAVYSMASHPIIINSILWGTCQGQMDINYSDIQGGWEGEGNINSAPLFVDAINRDFNLESGSPCIDAGTSLFVWEGDTLVNLSTDEYFGSAPDMGAHEYGVAISIDNLNSMTKYYSLDQNFPNPFNPTTTISYYLPEQTDVNLTVFDIQGKEVLILQDDIKSPGNYEVQWNGMDQAGYQVSGGVYFCRLQAGSHSKTIKMVYLR